MYDAAGNVVAFFDGVAGLNLSYEYDLLDRLVAVGGTYTRTYAYDPPGNLTNKTGLAQSYADPVPPCPGPAGSDAAGRGGLLPPRRPSPSSACPKRSGCGLPCPLPWPWDSSRSSPTS